MIKATKEFVFYHDGITPTPYSTGDELPEDAGSVALTEGWAESCGELPEAKSRKAKAGK